MVTPLQIIGHKNSGKTTVIEDFLTLLKQRQQSVCVLKHDPHQAQMDHPGTDTDKFTTAGAQTAVLVTNQAVMSHQKTLQAPQAKTLVQTYAKPGQFCLLEGFKTAPYPKVVLLRPGETAAVFAGIKQIIAFTSLYPQAVPQNCIDFSTTLKRQVWLQRYLKKEGF